MRAFIVRYRAENQKSVSVTLINALSHENALTLFQTEKSGMIPISVAAVPHIGVEAQEFEVVETTRYAIKGLSS